MLGRKKQCKNKTSGGKGTRGKNIVHCFVSLSCDPCICKTILTAHAPAYSCAKLYFLMNENLKTALEDSYTLGCHWNLNRQIIWYIIASLVLLINYTTCNIMHIHSSWNWMLFTIAWTKSPELAQTQAFHYNFFHTWNGKPAWVQGPTRAKPVQNYITRNMYGSTLTPLVISIQG